MRTVCTCKFGLFRWTMLTLSCVLSLGAGSPAFADRFDDLWAEGRPLLEPAGITKPMFRSLTVWTQGQYLLGYCGRYLPEGDVDFWRNWWANTVVSRTEVGRQLLARGAVAYVTGLDDAGSIFPAKQACGRLLEGWARDMNAANDRAKIK